MIIYRVTKQTKWARCACNSEEKCTKDEMELCEDEDFCFFYEVANTTGHMTLKNLFKAQFYNPISPLSLLLL